MSEPRKQYDLFIWGCTGFTGGLICDLLVKTHKPGETTLKYCFGGRNFEKMETLRKRLIETLNRETNSLNGEGMISSIPMFVCNSDDELNRCITNSKVCLNLSGPYTSCGEIVIKLCCENYTHYIDVSGESGWIKKMQRIYGASVASKGLKFSVFSGYFASVIDFGLLHLQNFAVQMSGLPCREVVHYVQHEGYAQKPSSGTLKSIALSMTDPSGDEVHSGDNPYALCSGKLCLSNIEEIIEKNKTSFRPEYNETLQSWTTSNLLSHYNSTFVHFSNEEMGYPYGMDFVFASKSLHGSYFSALTSSIKSKVGKFLIERSVVNKLIHCGAPYLAGSGPNLSEAKGTLCQSLFVGTTMQGKSYRCIVQAPDIEDYGISAITALACSFSIIFDADNLPQTFGISTPSCLLGVSAIKYCQELGLQFDVEHLEK
ncbi:saccharopine dehydrogenase [Cryptosporidium felis]|nr:saccharopine dehydrogenase [Cryptosporidium felis]